MTRTGRGSARTTGLGIRCVGLEAAPDPASTPTTSTETPPAGASRTCKHSSSRVTAARRCRSMGVRATTPNPMITG